MPGLPILPARGPAMPGAGADSAAGSARPSLLRVATDAAASFAKSALHRWRALSKGAESRTPSGPPGDARVSAESWRRCIALLSASPDYLAFIDRDYRYRIVNESYLKLFDIPLSGIVGRTQAEVWGREQFLELQKPFVDRALAGERVEFENILKVPGESDRRFHVTLTPITGTGGAIDGVGLCARDVTEQRRIEDQQQALLLRNGALVRSLGEIVYEWRPAEDVLIWEGDYTRILGYTAGEMGRDSQSWTGRIHPDDRDRVDTELESAARERRLFELDYRFLRKNGSWAWMHDRGFLFVDGKGNIERVIGVFRDVSAHKRAEQLLSLEKRVFEQISSGNGLFATLNTLALDVEAIVAGSRCSVLIADQEGTRLRLGAAPSMPVDYNRAVDGIPVGPNCGSCGTAAWRNEPVVVPDIATDPLWAEYRELGLRHGVRACWSVPIRSSSGQVLGTLAVYYAVPRAPDPGDLDFVDRLSALAGFAIERERKATELRESTERYRIALDSMDGGVWDWDLQTGKIYRSAKWRQMLGDAPGEYRDTITAWKDIIHPADRERVLGELRAHLEGDSAEFAAQYRIRAPRGEWAWVESRGRVVERSADGKALRMVGAALDIHQRKLAEWNLETRVRQAEFIGELTRMVLAGRELGEILDRAVLGSAQIIGVEFAGVLEMLPSARKLVLRAGVGWNPGEVGGRVVPGEPSSLAVYTLQSQESVIIEDLPSETRFQPPRLLCEHGIRSGLSVIIGDVSRPYGVLGVHTRALRRFDKLDRLFIENIANVIAEAVYSRETEHLVRQSRERLRNLAVRRDRVREEDRKRISREIHDELGQTLTGLRIDLAWILERLPRRRPDLAERAQSAMALADQTLAAVRRLSHDLRPAMLDDLGLEAAMEWQIGDFARRTGCKCEVDLKAGPIGMDNERDIAIFRVLQEALTNIARHAAADRVTVSLRAPDGKLILDIADNGCGISEEAIRSNVSIGLIGMRERAGALGGRIRIARGANGGTTLHMEMPLRRN